MSSRPVLPIKDLHLRHHKLTEHKAGVYWESASVCMSRHHTPPKLIQVSMNGGSPRDYEVHWTEPDLTVRLTYSNERDTTCDGACCVALAAAEAHLNLFAIKRCEHGEGAD